MLDRLRKRLYSPTKWAQYLGVKIGSDNLLGKDHWSSEPYLISIGSHCQLTSCKIFTHGGGQPVRDQHPDFDCFGKVTIGDYVYIGADALIMPGVTIGDHALIAAGSVVTRSVQANMVVAGNPAKEICTIQDYYARNKHLDTHSKHLNAQAKKELLLSLDETHFIKK